MLAHKLLAQIAFALAEHAMMTTILVAYSAFSPLFYVSPLTLIPPFPSIL